MPTEYDIMPGRQNETNVQLDKRKTHEVATRGFFLFRIRWLKPFWASCL